MNHMLEMWKLGDYTKGDSGTLDVGILMFPWASEGPYSFVNDVIEILEPITDSVTVITGNSKRIKKHDGVRVFDTGFGVHYIRKSRILTLSIISWVIKSVLFQLASASYLIRQRRQLDLVLFLGHPYETIPLLTCRILRIKSVEIVTRGRTGVSGLHSRLAAISEGLSFTLCSSISFETKALSVMFSHSKWKDKIIGESARFVHTDQLEGVIPMREREPVVAYIGRLRGEKGVPELLDAIPGIIRDTELQILLIGSGDLEHVVKTTLNEIEYDNRKRITFHGWMEKERISEILSRIMILVLPSKSEGLPTVILEAMAAGTIVLATGVGGIPDVIVHGRTGFIMKDCSSVSIRNGIAEILQHTDLDSVSASARATVKTRYSLAEARRRYEKILLAELGNTSHSTLSACP